MKHTVRWVIAAGGLAVALAAGAVWYSQTGSTPIPGFEGKAEAADSRAADSRHDTGVVVEVVHPRAGGIRRVCTQPGSVEPFESADLYARASGYLAEQTVDIGSRVKKGDLLARIAVPELEKQVERDAAKVKNANARVRQMEAHLAAAQAEAKAADAAVTLAKSTVRAKTSFRQYREKQLARMTELAKERALEARVVDEQEEFYQSAVEAENAAKEGVNTATEKATFARAKIDQAAADLDEARAGVEVATAEWERSKVQLGFAEVRSPYTGVITRRAFHVGEFVRSADQGSGVSLFSVERTDVMRVVVRVPDRDVPYVSLGDPATVEIDALPGVVFESKGGQTVGVSRWADAEDSQSRTMRTEVDLPNADGKLRRGMYGRVTIVLSEGTPTAVRVPSAALTGKAEGGRGTVWVVRDGTVTGVPVRYATDNGIEAEVVSGLAASDTVVVRAAGPLGEGTAVRAGAAPAAAAGH